MAGILDDPASEPDPMTAADPGQLGGYRLDGRLGRDGMSVVYRGVAGDGTRVAVKVIRAEFADDPRFAARFRREAEKARNVDSPHTARVLDSGMDGGRPYLVTEYVPGPTLEREAADREQEKNPFGPAQVEHLAVEILTALAALHDSGVLHLDLEPSNVLLSPAGPRVVGFGATRALDAASASTQGRSRVGRFGYLAPEQIRGEQVTPATDVFAWGATLTFAANGVGPFGVGDDVTLTSRTFNDPPVLGRLDPTLQPLVEQALSKDPTLRPPVRTLLDTLLGEQRESPTAPPAGPPPGRDAHPRPRPRSRARAAVAAAAAAATAAAVAAVGVIADPLGLRGNAVLGGCPQIEINTGHRDSPYYRYAQVLERNIEGEFPGSAVTVLVTSGSSDNLDRLRDPAGAQCKIAITQFDIAVHARYGFYDFEGKPIDRVRMVGPLWLDLVQLVVRQDSGIADVRDLCGRTTVATGLGQSGTRQIGEALFEQVEKQVDGCDLRRVPRTLPGGLDELRAGKVDAVLWAGGSPTSTIYDQIVASPPLEVRLLPLGDYRDAVQDAWDDFYREALGPEFVPGDVFETATTGPTDYPGVDPVTTFATPNGPAVNEVADPDLVRFVAESLVDRRVEFERALWGDAQGDRHFESVRDAVGANPAYCLVPLHDTAASYYQEMGIRPPCPS